MLTLCGVHLVHVGDEVEHAVGVAPLVVVPGDELDEVLVERDAGVCVEDRGQRAGNEVARHDGLLGVAQDALELVLRRALDLGLDLVVAGALGELDGEVDDGHVSSADTEGHAGELAVKLGDDRADGLGGTRSRGDDVARGGAAGAPVLAALGGAVNGELGGRHSVDSRHEALLNAPLVVDDLGERRKAVGGARRVGHDGHVLGVLVVVDAHDEHRGLVLGGGGDDDLLGTLGTLEMQRALGAIGEDAGALADVLDAGVGPRDLLGVLGGEDGDALAVDRDRVLVVGDGALEVAVHGVVLELVNHVLGRHERVVDGGDLDVAVLTFERSAENEAADATETVDANLDHVARCRAVDERNSAYGRIYSGIRQ